MAQTSFPADKPSHSMLLASPAAALASPLPVVRERLFGVAARCAWRVVFGLLLVALAATTPGAIANSLTTASPERIATLAITGLLLARWPWNMLRVIIDFGSGQIEAVEGVISQAFAVERKPTVYVCAIGR